MLQLLSWVSYRSEHISPEFHCIIAGYIRVIPLDVVGDATNNCGKMMLLETWHI